MGKVTLLIHHCRGCKGFKSSVSGMESRDQLCIFHHAAGHRYKPKGNMGPFIPRALHQNLINLKRTPRLISIRLVKNLVVDSFSEILCSSKNEQGRQIPQTCTKG